MDVSPIYAFAVGDSQALWEFLCVATGTHTHYSCGCALLRSASVVPCRTSENKKSGARHQMIF